jgi:hypothetical protein
MRVFVLVEPKFFVPPEMFPTLLDRFADWRDAHRESMEAFEFLSEGVGVSVSSTWPTRRRSTE